MGVKCQNEGKCRSGKDAAITLHVPVRIVGGMVVERIPKHLCAECARMLWKDDLGVFRPMTKLEMEAARAKERAVEAELARTKALGLAAPPEPEHAEVLLH